MTKIVQRLCYLFACSMLCVSAFAAPTESSPASVREQIEAESRKLTEVTAKLDLLETELLQRRPEVANLRLELKLLEEKMTKIRQTLTEYQERLEQFKRLSLEVQAIDQTLQGLRKQEAELYQTP